LRLEQSLERLRDLRRKAFGFFICSVCRYTEDCGIGGWRVCDLGLLADNSDRRSRDRSRLLGVCRQELKIPLLLAPQGAIFGFVPANTYVSRPRELCHNFAAISTQSFGDLIRGMLDGI